MQKTHYEGGLGQRKITFTRDNKPETFCRSLEEHYPKLRGIGGFELLRGSGSKRSPLQVIKPPPAGYTVDYVANSYLGQATCYVRPIQQEINLHVAIVSCVCNNFLI